MPTWGVRQPGHAAISRWTPAGWITCLGGGYVVSHWTENRYAAGKRYDRAGLDFEEESKARTNSCPCDNYKQLCLLECLAESLGETIMEAIDADKIWRSLSLVQRRVFANSGKDETNRNQQNGPPSRKEIQFQANGSIQQSQCYIIPASSCSNPPSKALLVMPSFLGANKST